MRECEMWCWRISRASYLYARREAKKSTKNERESVVLVVPAVRNWCQRCVGKGGRPSEEEEDVRRLWKTQSWGRCELCTVLWIFWKAVAFSQPFWESLVREYLVRSSTTSNFLFFLQWKHLKFQLLQYRYTRLIYNCIFTEVL